eukprot:PITA_05154
MEESFEEEEEEENETTKVIKMLVKVGGKPKLEIPAYEGSLNAEELMDWIKSLDKYFDYEEEADDKKKIGTYKDVILCDVMPMDVCHVLLGRPWDFDQKAIHDGRKNNYTLEKDKTKHTLLPLKDGTDKGSSGNNIILMNGKELLQEIGKGEEMHFAVIRRLKIILTSTDLDDLPKEIKTLLNDFADIIVDELLNAIPPIKSISHHIDLIPEASFPNKAAYKLTPKENAEVGRQVQELMDNGIIRESLSPCAIPIVLSPKKG